jgi:hypothetical protein
MRTIGRKAYHVRITRGSTAGGKSALIRETMADALVSMARARNHGGALLPGMQESSRAVALNATE